MSEKIIFAVPKGRIFEELLPIFNKINIIPEDDFFEKESRKLLFKTNNNFIDIIRVRSFDVATFLSYGAADIGVVGKDVLIEFNNEEIFAPLNLNIGKCKLALATLENNVKNINFEDATHLTVATKYPIITKNFFSKLAIQAETIKLNGAIELAPLLNMCNFIVDLVSTGNTLKANNLVQIKVVEDISSYLAVNRTLFKTKNQMINKIINQISEVIND